MGSEEGQRSGFNAHWYKHRPNTKTEFDEAVRMATVLAASAGIPFAAYDPVRGRPTATA